MRSDKVLEMINAGKITELKMMLQDEIYTESLKGKTNEKKRYTAMKKYFTYHKTPREILNKPCEVTFEGKNYISFCNSWSLALTTEKCREIELVEDKERYPDVARLLRFDGIKKKIDFDIVIAEAKSKGYRLNKTEVNRDFKYLMLYDGAYYKIGLLEATYRIIDTGVPAMTYHPADCKGPLTICTDLGFCMIMPVHFKNGDTPEENGHIVIEVE